MIAEAHRVLHSQRVRIGGTFSDLGTDFLNAKTIYNY